MTTVVNKYKVDMNDPDIVYIGRGSVWGNPFAMKDKSDEGRTRVIKALEVRYTQIHRNV